MGIKIYKISKEKSLTATKDFEWCEWEDVKKAIEQAKKRLYNVGCADSITLENGLESDNLWTPEQCALMKIFEKIIDESFEVE